MSIYTYLKQDHQKVEKLFEKILSTRSITKRNAFFEEVKNELLLHAKAESSTFYNALRDHKETAEIAEKADLEHAEVEAYLKKIRRLSVESERWMEQFGELKHSVMAHVAEEETIIFEKAKKILTKAQEKQLAEEMDKTKKELALKLAA